MLIYFSFLLDGYFVYSQRGGWDVGGWDVDSYGALRIAE
jgi:hypothetical protein